MEPTERHLVDLLAELRERLRQFAQKPSGAAAAARPRGALGPAERLALAARLLAAELADRAGEPAATAHQAFQDLADAVEHLPTPLSGSHLAADLEELVQVFEDLACAWDRRHQVDMALLWQRVCLAGRQLWPPLADDAGAPAEPSQAAPPTPAPAPPPAVAEPLAITEVWLLVAGRVRRETLVRRLAQSGVRVACPTDLDAVLADLAQQRQPDLLVCDDAAPTRYHQRLRARLGAGAPPLVMVRGRADGHGPAPLVWSPPYRPGDLLACLGD
ncbi:MAG: hypothetical protein R3D98_03765 [Candidatus Krumholzibacteriia bacterium]